MSVASTSKKEGLFPILLVNFIGTMGYSIVLPFLIVIVLSFGGNEIVYGALGATYSAFQLVGAPLLGRWSDQIGRRKVLLLSQVGTFIAWVIFLIALLLGDNPQFDSSKILFLSIPLFLLFVARALDGITGGNVSVANAYLADITPQSERKVNFGKMSASANLGFIAGPAMAGILGATALGEILPVAAAMLISLVAIGVISFQLKESNPCIITKPLDSTRTRKLLGQEHKECHEMVGEKSISFKEVMSRKEIGPLIILYFLIFLSFNFYYVSFPVYASTDMQWTVLELGIYFSIMSGLMILFQGPVLGWLSKRFNDSQLIIAGSVFLVIGFLLFMNPSIYVIGFALVIFSFGNGIMWPSFLAILSNNAGNEQGAIQGYASSAGSLASIIGLLAGGILFQFMGKYLFGVAALVMFTILIYVISKKQLFSS